MVIIDSITKRRKSYLPSLVVIIIAAIIVFFAWKMFLSEPKVLPPEVEAKYRTIKINFDTLKNPILEGLQSYPEIGNFEGTPGRSDPFTPY